MNIKQELLALARRFPELPGCYLMKNREEQIIYVGKSKNLKNRVSSYFTKSQKSPKTEILVGHIREVDFIIVENEAAALVLENNLIKKYRPHYNIHLKDDKSYPYIVVTENEEFPRLEYKRRFKRKKGDQVFGPFAVGSHVGEIIKILTQSFQLRDCTLRDFLSRQEPCLLYQMKQCSAPCVGKIPSVSYRQDLNYALNFFKNKGTKSLKVLNQKMMEASEQQSFERAAIIRDAIKKLEQFVHFQQKNAEVHHGVQDADYISYHIGEREVDISLYILRHGMILGHKNFHFPVIDAIDELDQVILSYLLQYYSTTQESLPKQLILDLDPKGVELFAQALTRILGAPIVVRPPSGRHRGIIELTQKHAKESQQVRVSNQESVYSGLNKLAELLGMKERPRVLECFDVAVFQGKSPTASQVVFIEGHPDKSQYRYYHLQERPEGNNDFAMMRELFKRRLHHGNLPDIFIVDGGIAQVNTVKKVLEEFHVDIPLAGVAKSKSLPSSQKFQSEEFAKSHERLIIPNRSNPFILSKNKALFHLVVHMRNEAHRFSRKLHHKKEEKRVIHSWIDEIPGIGRETKKDILRHLVHPPEHLREMNLGEISRALGIPLPPARKVKAFLKRRIRPS